MKTVSGVVTVLIPCLALVLGFSSEAAPLNSPKPTELKYWYSGSSLYLSRIQSARVVNVQVLNDPSYGEYSGMVSSAELRIVGEILPYGCGVSFLTDEIVGQVIGDGLWRANPVFQFGLGTVQQNPMGGGVCPGVPARGITLTLPLVGGIGPDSDRDRVFTYLLPGPAHGGRVREIRIRVLVNQKTRKLEILK